MSHNKVSVVEFTILRNNILPERISIFDIYKKKKKKKQKAHVYMLHFDVL